VLTEQNLKELQTLAAGGASTFIHPDTLRQLIAGARVANLAARVRRDQWDTETLYTSGKADMLESSQWNLDRALERYTQPQPQQVSQ
jgi:hypothetical protein